MSHRQSPPSFDGPVDVLLVEDNPGDVRLTREAFESTDVETRLHVFERGEDAVEFVRRVDEETDRPAPDIALLDLSLPGRDGREVLEAIRGDPDLQRLPVLMLTSSEDSDDVRRCYESHVNAYLTKPSDMDGFAALAEAVEQFWFDEVRLPPISQ